MSVGSCCDDWQPQKKSKYDNLHDSFINYDLESFKAHGTSTLSQGQCNMFVDSALEDGKSDMVKYLVSRYECQPSLYAKQMAHVNGHHSLASWTEEFAIQRNNTSIRTVHYRPKTGWNKVIPEKYRY